MPARFRAVALLALLAAMLFALPAPAIDDTVTAANVTRVSGPTITGNAGAAITAGQVVYLDASGNVQPAKCSGTATLAGAVGIALNSAPGANQPIVYAPSGTVVGFGAVLASGQIYVLSANTGNIAPAADLVTGNYTVILGVATSTSNLQINIIASGVTHP